MQLSILSFILRALWTSYFLVVGVDCFAAPGVNFLAKVVYRSQQNPLRHRSCKCKHASVRMTTSHEMQPFVTVLPGMKQVLFIEVGFGADQHGQVE